MHQRFVEAKELLNSFKNDRANLILSELLQELSDKKQLNSPFGLKVQVRQAEALEKDHQDEEAILKLLQIAEVSKQQQQWDVLANASLSLARLQEKMGRDESCLIHLREAESTIKQHHLDSIYPRFSIRISSYHRLFGMRDSALFYAEEVLRTAPDFEQAEEEAVGHLLMGMLVARNSVEKAITHYTAAGQRWKTVEDYSGYGAVMANLSNLQMSIGNADLALSYNDSSLIAIDLAEKAGHDNRAFQSAIYQKRGKIFQVLGQHDSAFFYQEKGYQMELAFAYGQEQEKIVEIEARYKDEQKAQTIREQAQQILYEKENRNWLIILCACILTFAAILIHYAIRLRSANHKTIEQAVVITQTNEELSEALQQQILLQGEVHHRVKNNLQVLIGLLELQSEDLRDPQAIQSLEAMANRIHSIAAIHEILYHQQGTEMVDLLEYTQNLCKHFGLVLEGQRKPVFQLNMEKHRHFNLETLMPLGIILNELLTNSLKYATNLGNQLVIGIELQALPDGFCLNYRDNGPGFPQGNLQEREGGLGSYLLKSMSRQLNGYMESTNENGAVSRIFFKGKNLN
ncbi:MAG: sensor histidine kinase [Bacteroidota bacterium]